MTLAKKDLEVQDKILTLQNFDLSYFRSKSHFEDDGSHSQLFNFLANAKMFFKKFKDSDHISAWKSKGLSDETIKPPATPNNSIAPAVSYIGVKTRAKFDGSCLKQDKMTFTHGNIVNIYIAYEIKLWNRVYDDY